MPDNTASVTTIINPANRLWTVEQTAKIAEAYARSGNYLSPSDIEETCNKLEELRKKAIAER